MPISKFIAKQASKPSGWFGNLFSGKLFNKFNSKLEDLGFEHFGELEGKKYLEIGFGNGRLIKKLAESTSTTKIFGIDISDEMINQARKNLEPYKGENRIHLMNASIEKIPYDSNYFDIIFTSNTIYFWPNKDENIREVKRVLKDSGKLIIGFREKDDMLNERMISKNQDIFKNLFNKDELKEFLEAHDFKNVEIKSRKNEPFSDHIAICGM